MAGRLFALSTVGSLVGTFVPALIAIPLIGTQRTLLGAAALLAASAALLLRGALARAPVARRGAARSCRRRSSRRSAGSLHEEESRYQFVQVVQRGQMRYLYLNEGFAIHSVWRPDTVLTGDEWDMFLAAPPLLGRPVAQRRDPRQRRRDDRAGARRLLPGRGSTASSSTPPSRPRRGAGSGWPDPAPARPSPPTRAPSSSGRTRATT